MKTTNYETSKKLKEIGFEAETSIYWNQAVENCDDTYYLCFHDEDNTHQWELQNEIKAYDLETILEALPDLITTFDSSYEENLVLSKNYVKYNSYFTHCRFYIEREDGETLTDCAANMLIKLVEEGIINLNK